MRVAFHTLGCKVNQYETEAVKEAFVSRGACVVGENEPADVYIVNTCTVTNIADRKSRQYIRRMKGVNPDALVVVTGCYAQVESEEVASMPEVNLVIGNGLKSTICDEVYRLIGDYESTDADDSHAQKNIRVLSRNELTRYEDMGLVVSSESGKTRAYIKIQDGCDRFCAYCLIPYARGPVRSRLLKDIVREAEMLISSGYKELVLTGINTALYGTETDIKSGTSPLEALISEINAIDGDFRIRLSSLEPTVVDKDDVTKLLKYDKLCHHLHLSVQAGSDKVLKSMNRHYTQKEYLDIVKALREFDDLYGITTDIIVGFPGETEDDFRESLRVVHESEFARVHIFRYSPRKGTVGESLSDAVPENIKSERASELEKVAGIVSEGFARRNLTDDRTYGVGLKHRVLTEERVEIEGRKYVTGYSGNYLRIYIPDEEEIITLGDFKWAETTDIFRDGLLGKL